MAKFSEQFHFFEHFYYHYEALKNKFMDQTYHFQHCIVFDLPVLLWPSQNAYFYHRARLNWKYLLCQLCCGLKNSIKTNKNSIVHSRTSVSLFWIWNAHTKCYAFPSDTDKNSHISTLHLTTKGPTLSEKVF